MVRYRRYFMGGLAALLIAAGTGCSAERTSTSGQAAGISPKTPTIELTVSAAASLKEAMDQVEQKYKSLHPEVKLAINLASSGTLQKQIEQGAPVDVFISAGEKQMNQLKEEGLLKDGTDHNLLQNELVLITPAGRAGVKELQDLTGTGITHIAVGEPESVPAGGYTKQSLEHAGLWGELSPKLIFAKDVRQVLTYVESGNADAGFVYKSDIQAAKGITTALTVDPASHDPINYPAAVIKASKHPAEAEELLNYLHSDEAADMFRAAGFGLEQP
ncbi:molybdate ABC transporter substrate-binding protein [Paenibacillus sp. JX-17]|uniref:Molybdate ABC transporter substrate-binding protein n=1 Tax=Paenibacillus lacisoli TaxID=3064525 RepID=A0ABT9CDQ1_9BACL|nr:molybdate ABC transporter substrate-binding protein [Paenibacillus sp. JX-17]MDO7907386.1 molybdate ABC transporter substrate-binding protein [Paenibacillus sp. JX-17]